MKIENRGKEGKVGPPAKVGPRHYSYPDVLLVNQVVVFKD